MLVEDKVAERITKTGTKVANDVRLGTHLCAFYQTKKDLIDILVPYFKAGLESNQFCVWVTSETLEAQEAVRMMRKAMRRFDEYLQKGQIEFFPHDEWYLKDGGFEPQGVLNGWIDKLNQALAQGYEGMRVSGDTAWIEESDWTALTGYEEEVNRIISKLKMIAICTYSRDKCEARQITDVVRNHQMQLIRQKGKWVTLEDFALKPAKQGLGENQVELTAAREALKVQVSKRKRIEKQLRATQKRYRSTLDNLLEGCQLIGFDWRYLYLNDAAVKHGHRTKKEILGHTMMETYPGIKDTVMFAYLRRCMEKRIPHRMENEFTFPDGSKGWFELSMEPVPEGVLVLSWDIAERKRMEERIIHLYKVLLTIRKINQIIVEVSDESELLRRVCETIVDGRNYKMAWIGFIQKGSYDVLPAAQAGFEKGYLSSIRITWDDSKHGRGPTGTAIKSRHPSVMRDIANDDRYRPWREQALDRGYASSAALPLMIEGRAIGTLSVYSGEPNAFDDSEIELLVELAGDLSLGIEKVRKQEKLRQVEEGLKNSEARLAEAQRVAHIGSWELDLISNTLIWSDEVYRMFGLETQQFRANYEAFLDNIHPDDREMVNNAYSESVRTKTPYNIVHRLLLKDGTVKYVNERCETFYDDEGKPMRSIGTVQDITERMQAEEELRKSEEKLRAMFESIAEGITFTDLEGKITDANSATLRLHGFSHKKELIGRSALELISDKDHTRAEENLRKTLERGYSGTLEYTLVTKDGKEFPAELSAALLRNELGNPEAFVAISADITERKQAEEKQRQSAEKLIIAMEATIKAMALTVEMRDPYTAGHQHRVTELAIAIGREMGLSQDQIEGLRLAGTIHDIGKIYVPAEILSKPGRLNEDEFNIIKTHPKVGYDILKGIDFPWPIAQIVVQHHERLDGSGYPARLSGEDILLEARILAVADVVEAMASHRPYRPALGVGQAMEEVSKNSGILYDPKVVDTCFKLFYDKEFKLE